MNFQKNMQVSHEEASYIEIQKNWYSALGTVNFSLLVDSSASLKTLCRQIPINDCLLAAKN